MSCIKYYILQSEKMSYESYKMVLHHKTKHVIVAIKSLSELIADHIHYQSLSSITECISAAESVLNSHIWTWWSECYTLIPLILNTDNWVLIVISICSYCYNRVKLILLFSSFQIQSYTQSPCYTLLKNGLLLKYNYIYKIVQ